MEITYKNNFNVNNMIIKMNNDQSDYREKMIRKNNIKGLLKMNIQHFNNETLCYYEIRSKQNMVSMFMGKEMTSEELRTILTGIFNIFVELDNYLLSPAGIIIRPDCIWLDPDSCIPEFAYFPDNEYREEETAAGFMELGQFLTDHIDKEDRTGTRLAYDYFSLICDGIYSPEILLADIENTVFMDKPGICNKEITVEEDDMSVDEKDDIYTVEEQEDSINNEHTEYAEKEDRSYIIKIRAIYIYTVSIIVAVIGYAALLAVPEAAAAVKISGDDNIIMGGAIAILISLDLIFAARLHNSRRENGYDQEEQKLSHFQGEEYTLQEREINGFSNRNIVKREIERKEYCDNSIKNKYINTELLSEMIMDDRPVLTGVIKGQKVEFVIDNAPYIIGKKAGKADAVINDKSISRMHALIQEDNGRYLISDMNSTNGTAVNDRRLEVNETAELANGDTLMFADIIMTFWTQRQYRACAEA